MRWPRKKSDPLVPTVRKPYEKPALRKLTEEQARLLLWGESSAGNEDAKKLLELFYPEIARPY